MNSFYQNWELDQGLPMVIHRSKDLDFYPHFHAEVEFVYVKSGKIRVGVNKESRLLGQGDMAVIGSNDIHYYDSRGLGSVIYIVIFHPEMIGKAGGWPSGVRFDTPFICGRQHDLAPLIRPLLERIFREKRDALPGHELFIQASLSELCGTLLRRLEFTDLPSAQDEADPGRERIQQILSYIENHYREDLSVETISSHFKMGPSYFCRMFKKNVGMNFKTFLNTIRVHSAKRKLESSGASITEIALECGFGSIRTFNRVYRQFQGHAPSEFRKEMK